MDEKDIRWNQFIECVCSKDLSVLSPIQRAAVLCFWYDAEMNSGGHSGYFDCYPETIPGELAEAIAVIANKEIAENYRRAILDGVKDGYVFTDNAYYNFLPSLCDYLMEFVEKYKEAIIDDIF